MKPKLLTEEVGLVIRDRIMANSSSITTIRTAIENLEVASEEIYSEWLQDTLAAVNRKLNED